MADQVMHMSEEIPFFGSSTPGIAPLVQRRMIGTGEASAAAAPVPAVVHDVLSSIGEPLDADSRSFFEPRFGHDFGRVRIHRDAAAGESARAINALAYTLGHHVTLDSRRLPMNGSVDQQHVLAHELAHVLQQASGAGEGIVRRKSAPAQEIEVFGRLKQSSRKSSQCNDQEKAYVQTAFAEARRWLDWAILCVNSIMGGPFLFSKTATLAREALASHFKSTDSDTTAKVLLNLQKIRGNFPTRAEFAAAGSPAFGQDIRIGSAPPVPLTVNSIVCGGRKCSDKVGAYFGIGTNALYLCPYFFSHRQENPGLLIHEVAHSLDSNNSVLDFGYAKDRIYRDLTTAEALLNADSYANLVEELATGRTRRMKPPKDTLRRCPDDWTSLIHLAIARAHQWARVAAKAYQGANTDPQAVAYEKVAQGLAKPVRIGCKTGCTAGSFWVRDIGTTPLSLCPGWKALSPEDQTIEIFAGLLGYFGGPGQEADWRRYAATAASLTQSKLVQTP